MSAVQTMVSEQFISAMGPMVNDEKKVEQVILFINSLSHQQKADGVMARAERDSRFVSLDESERTTIEMVHNHYQPVVA